MDAGGILFELIAVSAGGTSEDENDDIIAHGGLLSAAGIAFAQESTALVRDVVVLFTWINSNLTLVDDYKITIGKGCLFAPNVTISTTGHPSHPELRTQGMYSFPVTIGDNVWIGSGAVILPGVPLVKTASSARAALSPRIFLRM